MDKQKASTILKSIYQNHYGQWIIPHCPQHCKKEITLSNGEKAIQVMEDGVDDFLDYVKNLIEKAEVQ